MQINGRDELEIPVKANSGGEFVNALDTGSLTAIKMNWKCCWGMVVLVLKRDGVVECGTSELKKKR